MGGEVITKVKNLAFIIVALMLTFSLAACGDGGINGSTGIVLPIEPTRDEVSEKTSACSVLVDTEQNEDADLETDDETGSTIVSDSKISHPAYDIVFDFSVLPEEEFPRGVWNVNQLISKYGDPVDVWAYYLDDYGIAFVRLTFSKMHVEFCFESAELFSFYKEDLEEGRYELDENDKNLEIDILSLTFNNESTKLPYGITIGKTTKEQIIAYYPENTYYSWEDKEYVIDMIMYYYNFRDEKGELPEYTGLEGGIAYMFDKNKVLNEVTIKWYYFDL
jgi:hypothetical protein